uniref:ribonuclease III n=1 Tax=Locusta migratoria TaxID=7004 RepID=I3RT27_LOCMI|nr:Dicer1 [Locusta migratoria]BAW35364.1 Dicer1 [Locusta migratoria]
MAYYFSDNIHTRSLTPREHQVELLDAAKERNIIVCLCSSSGRVFIATKLIQEFSNAIRRPIKNGGKRSVYLVDSMALVEHQAAYINNLTDLTVGEYSEFSSVTDWEKELMEKQVLVMTSKVCSDIISSGILRIEDINVLILDECHNVLQNHPMRKIMRWVSLSPIKPRILGLTAPIFNSTADPGRLEGEMQRLEAALLSTAETASDIVSVLRYCIKPKEFVLECAPHQPGELDNALEEIVIDVLNFIQDHRYDPLEVYDDEFFEELKDIPDPKSDPLKILNEFLDVLHTLGPWCADRAAFSLLLNVEKLKVKTPYERHFLLLCMVSTVLVKIRAVCDDYFKGLPEKERILKFSSPKVLRLLEIIKQFKPVRCLCVREENQSVKDTKICTVPECCGVIKNREFPEETISVLSYDKSLLLSLNFSPSVDAIKIQNHVKCKDLPFSICDTAECQRNSNHTDDDNNINCFIKHRSFPVCIYNCSLRTCGDGDIHGKHVHLNGSTLKISEQFSIANLLRNVWNLCRRSMHSSSENLCHIELNKLSPVSLLRNLHIINCDCLLCKYHTYVSLYEGFGEETDVDESVVSVLSKNDVSSFCENLSSEVSLNNKLTKSCFDNYDDQKSEPCTPCRTVIGKGRSSKQLRKTGPGVGRFDVQGRNFRSASQDDADALCGIVFVEKKFTAKILYHLLNEIRRNDEDYSFVAPQYTVDKEADPLTEPREAENEHRKQEEVLKRFRMRECNLLVGTSVLEEGIDVPKCNLVIRFDVPSMYRSYVQSKGRARAPDAHYLLMIEESRTEEFIESLAQYFEIEQLLLRKCANKEPSEEEEMEADKWTNVIDAYSPPASPNHSSVNMSTAIGLVNRYSPSCDAAPGVYCAKLPSDTFTRLSPLWSLKTEDIDGKIHYICTVRLPINSPVKHNIVADVKRTLYYVRYETFVPICIVKNDTQGLPMPTRVLARRIAALETCRILHQARELDDNLMPVGKERFYIHEECDQFCDPDDLEDTASRDSLEPKPGTTKRRQYYYKRISEALTDCRPAVGEPSFLYNLGMVLTCPLPEEQNTRGRKIYPPEDSLQGFGILTSKTIPKICPFPIFTRSGEVSVKLELSDTNVVLTKEKISMIVTFLNYTFTSVLRLQKYLMMFDPQASENSYFIVPTRKKTKDSLAEVDWEFLERIYKECDLRPQPVPQEERALFVFDAAKYHDAVIMPWYRNQDQPQYFYVAEICSHLNPKSTFPGSEYKTFDEYYFKKYNIQIQNEKQPLLDVDHTSARLNFLTPRYVNRKGVALPTSSEETKRAKRENLEQKQILVPELCTVHPFPASLWRKAVCLPCILYRINALLLADQIRCQVANDIALGGEELPADFEWPPLNFGWSLADVLKKPKENAAKALETKMVSFDEDSETSKSSKTSNGVEITEIYSEEKQKTANEILTEEENKLSGEWMEIGTWSNDMAEKNPMESGDIDEFDPNIALPSNLTLLGHDSELADLHNGGGSSDWGTGIEAQFEGKVRYGSPSSWMTADHFTNFDGDCIGYESDDSYNDLVHETDSFDYSAFQVHSGIRIEFKSDNVAEAVEDEPETKQLALKSSNAVVTTSAVASEVPWNWDMAVALELDVNHFNQSDSDSKSDIESDKITELYANRFDEATKKNICYIRKSGILIRKDEPLRIVRSLSSCAGQVQNTPVEIHIQRSVNESLLQNGFSHSQFVAGCKIIFNVSKLTLNDDDDAELETKEALYMASGAIMCDRRLLWKDDDDDDEEEEEEEEEEEDIISKFSFDAQPELEGHTGPSPSIILQALTMSNANDGINLERLETIGDSFLKYAITTYLYCTYDNIHEGKLSHLRSKQVSNLNLYRLGRRKVFGESMIATKFEPHDNWLPPCYYVPRELEQALVEAGIPASHWNRADIPNLLPLSREEICELVRERCNQFQRCKDCDEDGMPTQSEDYDSVDKMPCFIPYNLITQHSIPDKSVADCVEALIGAYLIACGPRGALLFMAWLGICVLPREEIILKTSSRNAVPKERPVGSLKPTFVYEDSDGTAVWKQVRYGTLQSPSSPLLRNVSNPERKLEALLDGFDVFEQKIQYKFRDRSYLLQSLTHASYSPNRLTDCYQRLEFLGDAVLDYLITRHLYEDSRQHSPGALTDLRSALVNNTIFASLAVRYGFHKFFRHLSPGLNEVVDRFVRIQEENGHTISEEYYLIEEEECEEAEDVEVPKALGDVFESVAGAIFLDSNMSLDAVWRVYYRMMKLEIEQFSTNVPKSPIRELLELEPETAKFGKPEKLADGRRVRVSVEVFGKGIFKGIGRNYRIAKCTAAKCALKQLKKKGLLSKKL